MFKNYITIAWRNITRHKLYAAINVFGLAMGITCCLFIYLWVRDERSIDNFHEEEKDLYTVYIKTTANKTVSGTYTTPERHEKGPVFLLDDVAKVVPEVRNIAFYSAGYELPWGYPETLQVGDKLLKLDGSRAGEDFFKLFPFPLIQGNAATALADMNGIALSRKTAIALFGSPQAAMGKSVRFENKLNFVVTAVFEDLPAHSAFHFDFLNNWEAQKKLLEFSSNDFRTYVRLSPGTDPVKAAAGINSYLQTRLEKLDGVKLEAGLQRVSDQYLYNVFENGRPTTGRIEYVRIFTAVALFILAMACINFMNLATARSVKRAKEVGLRKVVGSGRRQLIAQFLGESIFFSVLAMLISIVLLLLFLPAFNEFSGKDIRIPVAQPAFWIALLGITVLTGLVAGSYPALYLSSLQPVRILKGVVRFTSGSILFRKGLTVFQFVLSMFLLIATIVITRQTRYVQQANLGYDRENIVYIRLEGALSKMDRYLLFKERASNMPGIAMVDRSTETPHSMNFVVPGDWGDIKWEGMSKDDRVDIVPASVGFDFVRLMGLSMAEGRDFSRTNPTDSSDAFLVNETAVRKMGLRNPIGKWVSAWKKKGHIIGVIRDYHMQSFRETIRPVLLDIKEYEYFGVIMVKTKPGQTRQAIASLTSLYKELNPNFAFAWQFMDTEYNNMYKSEMTTSGLAILFSSIAIGISCLGLLGLVMFAAEQRIKEIGIRKVLGATLGQLISLFSTDFLRLIGIAFLIAVPLGWFSMNAWLHDFAYRIDLSLWIFLLAGAAVTGIALATICFQAVKAGLANPVKSLRTE